MINNVRKHINQQKMIQRGDRVIVGVSGGADSMALLSVLSRLRDDLAVDLVVAHLNHGLRGRESDEDAGLVRRTAEAAGLPFFDKKVDIGTLSKREGLSLEDMARRERYAFFYHLMQSLPADKIALGHHLNDQAETVLLNFLRGAGSRGLRGILPVRDQVLIRPLLNITREQILFYLEREKIHYREDGSNQSELFLRNRVRHHLLPYMKQYNPRIEEGLHRLAETMRIENNFLEEETAAILNRWGVDTNSNENTILINDMICLHEAMQRRVIKSILESRSQERNGISQAHVSAVIGLVRDGHVGQQLSLPFTTEVLRHYDRIVFIKKSRQQSKRLIRQDRENPLALGEKNTCSGWFEYPIIGIPAEIEIKETGTRLRLTKTKPLFQDLKVPEAAYLDYDKIEFPLRIRNICPGDRFQPLGLSGTKKVKSFFIDRKIPREKRQAIPLLVDRKNILWVVGMATSDIAKFTPSTRICLKIEII